MHSSAFWDITLCRLETAQRFGRMYCLHLHGGSKILFASYDCLDYSSVLRM
jgi:hypothetical protein